MIEAGQSLAAKCYDGSGLGAGRQVERRGSSLRRRHIELAAEGGLAEGDRQIIDHVVTVAFEAGVVLDLDAHKQVPLGTAAGADGALSA